MSYAFDFSEHSVYANVLRVLEGVAAVGPGGIVLDLGCGNAALAGAVTAAGASYVGVDVDDDAVARLGERDLEGHVVDLGDAATIADALDRIVAGRRVQAILGLDVVEHLAVPGVLLTGMRDLAAAHAAPIVLSIPNVTHADVGVKLLTGRWDVTESGLLDATHLQHFSGERLETELHASGLRIVATEHFVLERSDQAFPESHPLLDPVTTSGRLLRTLREQASPHGLVNQFVVACMPAPAIRTGEVPVLARERPFATVVLRTQGRREVELRETLLCLAAQTVQDFELVVLGHRLDAEERATVDRLLDAAQCDLASRTRLILVEEAGRAEMLNIGFRVARGRYVVVLDDDDLVLGDWIEQFSALERKHGGRILRGRSALQDHSLVRVADEHAAHALRGLDFRYDVPFSHVEHLADNYSPFMTLAFPRGIWHELGVRFDASMTTVEDYDFLLRAAALVGVSEHAATTAIYRHWVARDSSRTEHHDGEWTQNVRHIERKLDREPLLLPVGATAELRALLQRRRALEVDLDAHRTELARLHGEIGGLHGTVEAERAALPAAVGALHARMALEREAASLLASRSWLSTAWMRGLRRLVGGGRPMRVRDVPGLDDAGLAAAILAIRSSRSWRSTAWLRDD